MSIKGRLKHALHVLGYYRGRLTRSPYDGVAVLAYHGVRDSDWPAGAMRFEELHVTVERLESHFSLMRDLDCTLLSWAEWQQVAAGRRDLPPRAVLVTFDDGYRNVLTYGLPVLERHAIPAVIFVCTNPVARGIRFWFDAVAEHEGENSVERAKALEYERWRACVDRLQMPATPGDPHAPLTIAELQDLAAHPLITIGAHTESHPILAHAPPDVQRREIARSRETLELWIGKRVTAFAYPNGRPRVDYTPATIQAVADSGFEHAFTTASGFARPVDATFEHPRFMMLQGIDAPELGHRLAVSWPAAVTS